MQVVCRSPISPKNIFGTTEPGANTPRGLAGKRIDYANADLTLL